MAEMTESRGAVRPAATQAGRLDGWLAAGPSAPDEGGARAARGSSARRDPGGSARGTAGRGTVRATAWPLRTAAPVPRHAADPPVRGDGQRALLARAHPVHAAPVHWTGGGGGGGGR